MVCQSPNSAWEPNHIVFLSENKAGDVLDRQGRLARISNLQFFRRVYGVDCQVETSLLAISQSCMRNRKQLKGQPSSNQRQ